MAKFAYKNVKNASTNHAPFELNYENYPRVSYEKTIDPHSKLKLVDKLLSEL